MEQKLLHKFIREEINQVKRVDKKERKRERNTGDTMKERIIESQKNLEGARRRNSTEYVEK